MIRIRPTALAALAAGCAVQPDPADLQLLVPDEVPVDWDEAFNGADDGLAALVPVDVMVYAGASGEPVRGVALELRGIGPGVGVVPTDAVHPARVDAEGTDVVWDAWRDRYVVFDTAPGEVSVSTDETGLARVYVVVDRFALVDGEPGPAAVVVSSETLDETFLLFPR